jgi:hypothetical protein
VLKHKVVLYITMAGQNTQTGAGDHRLQGWKRVNHFTASNEQVHTKPLPSGREPQSVVFITNTFLGGVWVGVLNVSFMSFSASLDSFT